ncbi:hypothetical protein RIF29_38552 [Crotalaria pallida]|uniref:Uncharacterized protein n=1 Tax=Crotalaria pallida TaxID=3830 RepID=A0AAN9E0D7_CROPI
MKVKQKVLCLCLNSKVHLYDSMEQGQGLLLEWIYIAAFAIGMGPVSWVIMSEVSLDTNNSNGIRLL